MTARRLRRGVLVAATAGALLAAAPAMGALRVKNVDASEYPLMRVTVVAPSPSTPAPVLKEDGQRPEGFQAARIAGKSVVIAIDRSQSMRGKPLERATAAADAFVQSKPADDRVAVISFGKLAIANAGFSAATIDADGALGGLAVDTIQGTALYDAISLGSNMLASEASRNRILILLTDGRDISSQSTLDDALTAARNAGVHVYTIGIRSRQFTPALLKEVASRTGGTYYAATTAQLGKVYGQIGEELRRTWVLQYLTAARAGATLQLAVAAKGAGSETVDYAIPDATATTTEHRSKGGGWVRPAILGILVGLLVFIGSRLLQSVTRRSRLRSRLDPYFGDDQPRRRQAFEASRLRDAAAPVFGAIERLFSGMGAWQRLERRLVQSDLPIRTVELVTGMFGLGLLLALIATAAGGEIWAVLPAFLIGAVAPYVYVAIRAERRLRTFENQLPGVLNTLGSSLTAGHSFTQALQGIVENEEPPIADEFARVLAEAQLGRRLEGALLEMANRISSRDLDFVVRAVIVQRQVGGSLAGLFELVADTVEKAASSGSASGA
jgi:tight adherence protein B